MRTRFMAHVVAAVVLGIVLGVVTATSRSADRAKGREAYLVEQAKHFDKNVAKSRGVFTCVAGVAFSGFLFGVYELLALGIYGAIRPKGDAGAA